jgi:hypothetical protein
LLRFRLHQNDASPAPSLATQHWLKYTGNTLGFRLGLIMQLIMATNRVDTEFRLAKFRIISRNFIILSSACFQKVTLVYSRVGAKAASITHLDPGSGAFLV